MAFAPALKCSKYDDDHGSIVASLAFSQSEIRPALSKKYIVRNENISSIVLVSWFDAGFMAACIKRDAANPFLCKTKREPNCEWRGPYRVRLDDVTTYIS